VQRLAAEAEAVAFSGSLPPGVEPAALAALARAVAAPERPVYLDTSVAALKAALAQPSGLCLKVNRAELAEGLDWPVEAFSTERFMVAGQELLGRGAELIVVTLGEKGALALNREGCWQANPPPVAMVSTVGSGDSFLAGLAVARLEGKTIKDALAFAVACGAANATTRLPGRFEQGVVESLLAQVTLSPLRPDV
jgi:fructose-1-phosphate kinase PfkB-like protein